MFLNMLTSATISFLRQSPCMMTWSLSSVSAWSNCCVIYLNIPQLLLIVDIDEGIVLLDRIEI